MGGPCKNIGKDLALKRKMWGLVTAEQSVEQCLTTCDYYLANIPDNDHPMHTPLICAMVVLYSRPFGDNKGVGMISEKLVRYQNPKHVATHRTILDARHRFYAHSDATVGTKDDQGRVRPVQPIIIQVRRRVSGRQVLHDYRHGVVRLRMRGIIVPVVKSMCVELLVRIREESRATLYELYKDRSVETEVLFQRLGTPEIEIPLDLDF